MNKKIIILMLVMFSFLIPVVMASASFTFKTHENFTIEIPMANANLSDCTVCSCQISIFYSNGTEFVKRADGTNENGFCRYINHTNLSGSYDGEMFFNDTVDTGRVTFKMEVNPAGIEPTLQRTQSLTRAIYFFIFIAVILLISFFFTNQSPVIKWTLFIFSVIFFLIAMNIISVSIADEVVNPKLENFLNDFTIISWYFYYFAGFLLVVMWFLAALNTWILKTNQRNLRKYGLME